MKLKSISFYICVLVLIFTVSTGGLIGCETQQQNGWIKVDHPELKDEKYISEVKESYPTFIFDAVSVYFDFIENLGDNSIIKDYKIIKENKGDKIFQAKSLQNLRFLEVRLVLETLPESDGLEIWIVSEYRYLDAEDKVIYLAEIWAESLKTRDGKPRYEIMSEELKENFIEKQKQRAGGENWNYNIGGSSPWVEDYEIAVEENTASIRYLLADSIPQYYEHTETLTIGEEDGKLVVINVEESLDEWQKYYYFAPTVKQAMGVYIQALLENSNILMLSIV